LPRVSGRRSGAEPAELGACQLVFRVKQPNTLTEHFAEAARDSYGFGVLGCYVVMSHSK
jgi:hypothetical protein